MWTYVRKAPFFRLIRPEIRTFPTGVGKAIKAVS